MTSNTVVIPALSRNPSPVENTRKHVEFMCLRYPREISAQGQNVHLTYGLINTKQNSKKRRHSRENGNPAKKLVSEANPKSSAPMF